MTTSKTKQLCETSFKNGKLSAELAASCQGVLLIFHSACLKYCACHEKVRQGHTKCCTCHAKLNPLPKTEDLMLQNATPLMNMSLVLRLPRKMYLFRPPSISPRMPSFLEMLQNSHVLLTFDKVHNPSRLPCETTPERPKVVRTCFFFPF